MASNANKRSRRRKHLEDEGEPEFQVAPMIDVLLVLTLFFMSITSSELLKKDKNLSLPDANDAKPDQKNADHKQQIVVNIGWDHINNTASFTIDGKAFPDANSLQGYVAQQAARTPGSYVLLRADRDVQYSNVSDVMSSCAAAGIGKVSFACITSGNQKHKGAVQAGTAAPAQ